MPMKRTYIRPATNVSEYRCSLALLDNSPLGYDTLTVGYIDENGEGYADEAL